ncbi:MMPL family transporter [Lentzea aerocolonigenes]|uniref:MMPL family transporter n=1 Tax=Lentzea aerocolonigenes TaxID=68170 RepID=UPI0006984044|nr:MMPL family transporter [Lentzea aerocolonigenes]
MSSAASTAAGRAHERAGLFGTIGRVVVRHRWWVMAFWVVLAAAAYVFAPAYSSVVDPAAATPVVANSESARANGVAGSAFSRDQGVQLVFTRADGGVLSGADIAQVGVISHAIDTARPAGVKSVTTTPQSLSQNKKVAVAAVVLATDQAGSPEAAGAVTAVRSAAQDKARASGLVAGVTGPAAMSADFAASIERAERLVGVITLILVVLLMIVAFRSVAAPVVPLIAIGIVFVVARAAIAAAATAFGFTVPPQLLTLLIVVLFGIGTDYVLFLLFRYRDELRSGGHGPDAVITAVRRIGEVIASAGGAVTCAFLTLLVASLAVFRTLGAGLAIGVVVMVLAALTLVPAVVSVLGPAVFWPSKPHAARAHHAEPGRIATLVARRPFRVVLGALVLLGVLAGGLATLRLDYDNLGELPQDSPGVTAYHQLTTGYPVGSVNPVSVYLRTVDGAALSAGRITAVVNTLRSVPHVVTVQQPIRSSDNKVARIDAVLDVPPASVEAMDLAGANGVLRNKVHEAAGTRVDAFVGGQSSALADLRAANSHDLRLEFPIAGALIVLVLALLLRRPLTAVLITLAVLAGFAATLGATGLLVRWFGENGVNYLVPTMAYLFVLAIGSDYAMLVVARVREEHAAGLSTRDAIRAAVSGTAGSVLAAGAILAGTFASLLFSGVTLLVETGIAVTTGIVLTASIVALLLVPGLLALTTRSGKAEPEVTEDSAEREHAPV